MASIFAFDDYRIFLRKFYEERKARDPKFTHRFIERKLGLKSAGHFTQILQNKVNISTHIIAKFTELLALKKKESEYFESLVLYNQAKSHEEKKRYFEKMIGFRDSGFKLISLDQYLFFQKWYYTAIHELLDITKFRGDYLALGKKLTPPISADQAQEAVALLLRLGLICKLPDGGLAKKQDVLSTGNSANSLAINNFQLEMMDIARGALDRFPQPQRSFSTLTLSITEEGHRAIQEELRAFRRRALEIARKTDKADSVYQYNFQVFPLALPGREKAL
jgi:uncharacterized protein (TIGR02147 family)